MNRYNWLLSAMTFVVLIVGLRGTVGAGITCEEVNEGKPVSEDVLQQLLQKQKTWLTDNEPYFSQHDGQWNFDVWMNKPSGSPWLCGLNISHRQLKDVDLRAAFITQGHLRNVSLWNAKLNWINLINSDLVKADLHNADLRGANLSRSNMRGADLTGALLEGADFSEANLADVIFETSSLPSIRTMFAVKNLAALRYVKSPDALYELREAFKRAGLRQREREVTFAIKHQERLHSELEACLLRRMVKSGWERSDGTIDDCQQLGEFDWYKVGWKVNEIEDHITKSGRGNLLFRSFFLRLGSLATYVLFEFPSGYGLFPERCLILLITMIPFFGIAYAFSLTRLGGRRIWVVWPEDRIERHKGDDQPEQLRPRWYSLPFYALYFSALSAFQIGWRDFNVGHWIVRLQPSEVGFRATGWTRTVSGIQSLLSVYLLALWVLTYFGRPFE